MKTLTIGITGGLGAGKSLACAALRSEGAFVIDADEVAREQAKPGGSAYRRIVKAFGKEILSSDGTIDRKRLGERVFRKAEQRRKLEKITHPLVRSEIMRRVRGKGLIYVAAPLLFESGLDRKLDLTITISAPLATRLRRAARRGGLSAAQASARSAAQMTERARTERADLVLLNSGTKQQFSAKLREYHKALSLLRHGAAAQ